MIATLEVILLIAIPAGWLYLVRLIIHRQNRIDDQLSARAAAPSPDPGTPVTSIDQSDVRRA